MEIVSPSKRSPRRRTFLYFILGFSSACLCALYTLSSGTGQAMITPDSDYLSTDTAFVAGNIPRHQYLQEKTPAAVPSSVTGVLPSNNNQMRRTLTSDLPSASCSNASLSPPKLILLWTPFFGYWGYFPQGPYKHCSSCSNCQVTTDRKRLSESDAVVFHVRDMSLSDLPYQRTPHQVWVFYCLESPPYSNFPGLNFMHEMFNWTMTYRSDSDVFAPYGVVKKVAPRSFTYESSLPQLWKNKTKSVVWISSHCPTDSARDDYVTQLKSYIDIEIYGSCGDHSCPISTTDACLRRFERTYKFYLAFENSLCKDYITEKFFRALKYGMIPVVFGGGEYEKYAPVGSYINALSFRSPKHLAYYLHKIAKDFSLYSAYFRWKEDHMVNLTNDKECILCNRLHDSTHVTSVYKDMKKWWIHDSKCWSWRDDLG